MTTTRYTCTQQVPDAPGWFVKITLSELAGRLECTAVEVSSDPPTPITTAVLRMPLAELVREARRDYLAKNAKIARTASPTVAARAQRQTDRYQRQTDRYQRLPEGHLAEVARVYAEALRVGDSPTKAVAEQLHGTRSAAAKWVARARQEGLLGQTVQRKAGGLPPPPTKRKRKA